MKTAIQYVDITLKEQGSKIRTTYKLDSILDTHIIKFNKLEDESDKKCIMELNLDSKQLKLLCDFFSILERNNNTRRNIYE